MYMTEPIFASILGKKNCSWTFQIEVCHIMLLFAGEKLAARQEICIQDRGQASCGAALG